MAKKLSASEKVRLLEKFSKAASTTSGRVHVVPSKDGWAVKKEGAKRASSVQATKASAVKAATGIKSADRVIVHRKDGTIQKNTSLRK